MSVTDVNTNCEASVLSHLRRIRAGHLSDLSRKFRSVEEALTGIIDVDVLNSKYKEGEVAFRKFVLSHEEYITVEVNEEKRRDAIERYEVEKDKWLNLTIQVESHNRDRSHKSSKGSIKTHSSRSSKSARSNGQKNLAAAKIRLESLRQRHAIEKQLAEREAEAKRQLEILEAETELKIAQECVIIDDGIDDLDVHLNEGQVTFVGIGNSQTNQEALITPLSQVSVSRHTFTPVSSPLLIPGSQTSFSLPCSLVNPSMESGTHDTHQNFTTVETVGSQQAVERKHFSLANSQARTSSHPPVVSIQSGYHVGHSQGYNPPVMSIQPDSRVGYLHTSNPPIMSLQSPCRDGHYSGISLSSYQPHSGERGRAASLGLQPMPTIGESPIRDVSTSNLDPLQVIADAIRQGPSLPKIELIKFDGNPRDYIEFITNFVNNIETQVTRNSEKLTRLLAQCVGKANEAIKGCVNLPPNEGYNQARQILYENFGRPHMVAEAQMARLKAIKLHTIDASTFMAFSRVLEDVWRALHIMGPNYSSRLDNEDTIKLLMRKLPTESLKRKWAEQAGDLILTKGFVKFTDFVDFAKRIGNRLNNTYGDELKPYTFNNNNKGLRPKVMHPPSSEKVTTMTSTVSEENKKFPPCPKCNGSHGIWKCSKFKEGSIEQKKQDIRKYKLCNSCLGTGHFEKDCKRGFACRIKGCSETHHTLIHQNKEMNITSNPVIIQVTEDNRESLSEESNTNASSHIAVGAVKSDKSRVCFKVVPVKVRNSQEKKECITYAFLDSGSDSTLCLKGLSNSLSCKERPFSCEMETTTGCKSMIASEVSLQIAPLNQDNWFELPKVITTERIPVKGNHIAAKKDLEKWPHLRNLELSEVEEMDVTILIGSDHPELTEVQLDLKRGNFGEPFGIKTPLGWTVCGPMGEKSSKEAIAVNVVQVKEDSEQIRAQFQRLYNKEFEGCISDGIEGPSYDDMRARKIMEDSITVEKGHYQIGLPFKDDTPKLPDSLPAARRRLSYLKKRLERNPELKEQYCSVMKNYEEEGAASIVTDAQLKDMNPLWFLPHHAVFHPRKPNQPRVVFDCAAKVEGVSLNDKLLKGPENTSTLLGVLLRFRIGKIGVAADIKRMFHQVFVKPEDRGALCYLWWADGDFSKEPKVHQMLVHIFGATSSPSVCGFALRQTAKDYGHLCSEETMNCINHSFYVDDILKGFETEEDATKVIGEIKMLLERRGFHLTKFQSSSKNVLAKIPIEERAPSLKDLNLDEAQLPTEQALGVQWNVEDDTLSITISNKEYAPTRRGILSSIASVFDPLGIASPFLLPGREINQHLCTLNLDWDSELPQDILKKWEEWRKGISKLKDLKIKRCYTSDKSHNKIELHHFSDASEQHGYGTASYLRFIGAEGEIFCSFCFGKSRVKPLRAGMTVPKLELTAAAVLVTINQMLTRELSKDLNISSVTFWTDSIIVLKYLHNNDKRFVQFVANRVAKIREGSSVSQWKHVRSEYNPADIASRGMSVYEDKKLGMWLNGPEFLWRDEKDWPDQPQEMLEPLKFGDEGLKKDVVDNRVTANLSTCSENFWYSLLRRFSSWRKLRRVVAWILKAVKALKRTSKPPSSRDNTECVLSVEELLNAEIEIIKAVQRESFDEESTGAKKLVKLSPFISENVLRVGGRLSRSELPFEFKHPMILPSNHHVTQLIIIHYHLKTGHSGAQYVLSQVRKRFWIVSGVSTVRRALRKCHECRVYRARTGEQVMAPLPSVRISSDQEGLVYPFSAIGLDLFGPLQTKKERITRSNTTGPVNKRYGCIFTCLRYRAVHLELVKDLSTDSFINAVLRFVSRRGPPRVIFSDNGSNFKGAERDVLLALKAWNTKKIRETFEDHLITWHFNPPAASHQGGVWERLIRSVRRILHSLLRDRLVSDEELSTFLCEVEKMLNDRPITRISDDPNDLEALTPNHILLLRRNASIPSHSFLHEDSYKFRWKHVGILANQFWKRWLSEYVPTLQERQKWLSKKCNFRPGDFVLLVDKDLPRGQWSKGIIEHTFPDQDGSVRRVSVRTSKGHLIRDIRKLCLLEQDIFRSYEEHSKTA